MQSPQAKLKEITRLLGSWPSAAAPADGDEQLRSYLLAVEDYNWPDVEAGVTALIKGIAPGVNPNFLPPPAAVGGECRRQLHLRLDRERRAGLSRPALPPPQIEVTPEARARVAAMVAGAVADLSAVSADERSETERGRKSLMDRTNARFDAERGYSVGDRDGERDVA